MSAPEPPSFAANAGDTPRPGDTTLVILLSIFGVLLADGGLMVLLGAQGLLPTTLPYSLIPPALAGAGLLGTAVLLGPFRGRLRETLHRVAPRLYPLGPMTLNLTLYFLVVASVVTVFHAFFDVFTGAHYGGSVAGLADQTDLTLLLIGGSVLVWFLTLYAVLVIARVIRMGQNVQRLNRSDPYHRHDPPSEPPVVWVPAGARASPPSPRAARPTLFVSTVVVSFGISAAIQILEGDISPAPVLSWLWAQLFTPVWALGTAAGIAYIDSGLRALERDFLLARERAPAPRSTPQPVAP